MLEHKLLEQGLGDSVILPKEKLKHFYQEDERVTSTYSDIIDILLTLEG